MDETFFQVGEFEDCGHEAKCTRMVDYLSTFEF